MVSYIVLNYIRAPLNFKVALSEMYLALGPFAVRVVIQFSRIVPSSARSKTARRKVRGELVNINCKIVDVNSFFFLLPGFPFGTQRRDILLGSTQSVKLVVCLFFPCRNRVVDRARKAAKYWIRVHLSTDTFRKS